MPKTNTEYSLARIPRMSWWTGIFLFVSLVCGWMSSNIIMVHWKLANGYYWGAWGGLFYIGNHGFKPAQPGLAVSRNSLDWHWLPTWHSTIGTSFWAVGVPMWMPAALALGCLVLLRVNQGKLASGKHCRACGYNTRGLISSVCPECGNRFTAGNELG